MNKINKGFCSSTSFILLAQYLQRLPTPLRYKSEVMMAFKSPCDLSSSHSLAISSAMSVFCHICSVFLPWPPCSCWHILSVPLTQSLPYLCMIFLVSFCSPCKYPSSEKSSNYILRNSNSTALSISPTSPWYLTY